MPRIEGAPINFLHVLLALADSAAAYPLRQQAKRWRLPQSQPQRRLAPARPSP